MHTYAFCLIHFFPISARTAWEKLREHVRNLSKIESRGLSEDDRAFLFCSINDWNETYVFQKNEKKVVKSDPDKTDKTEKEKPKPRTDDVPTTSSSSPMAVDTKPNGGRSEEAPTTTIGGDDAREAAGIRHPAIFSTKIGNEAAAAAAEAATSAASTSSASTPFQPVTTSLPINPPPAAPAPVVAPPTPVIPPLRPTTNQAASQVSAGNGGGGGNPRESSWQTAAYV